ncbi:uncharacterized protein N0V89_001911 [Didymosphaeria variabile]|uniref:Uncharacterized protein n=1 Tax=Didymosphaeria variabile TaxID=1932322 RepID=A0A9W9CD25_9PLEO|nr:uncharacterized protein N0V89_001911 [Didymosphaeria variabile]KAJ4357336.1 hypothetical protein N0V89_001911 [Didymosphaeria variabile]
MSTGPASTLLGLATTYVDNGKFADAAALYSAALMAPEAGKLSQQDPWGNVKIPILNPSNLSSPMTGQWQDVKSLIQTPEAYSSLVGLPVVGLPLNESSSFIIETTYLVVDCEPFKKSPYPSNITSQIQRTNYTRLEELVPGQVWSDKSIKNDPFKPQERITSFFIDTDRSTYGSTNDTEGVLTARLDAFLGNQNTTILRNGNDTVREPRKLLFASVYPRGDKEDGQFDLNVAHCLVSQAHVEVGVRCQGTLITYGLAQNFPLAVATGVLASTATERFLANSSSYPFVQNAFSKARESYVDLSAVPKEAFSSRLGLLLNTYYQLSTQPLGYFGSLSRNLSLYGPDVLPATDVDAYLPANLSSVNMTFLDLWSSFEARVQDNQAPFIGATTTANVTTTEEVFVCNFAWLSLLLAASNVILITGIVALILKRMTLGPEFFGPVASMTYENPFVKIPEGGSTLDAMERARIMRDVEVYVADVAGEKDVGHVAFAAGVPLRKLERSRTYA